jgi:hypothetical protein
MSPTHHDATQSANISRPSTTHPPQEEDDNGSSTTGSTNPQVPLPCSRIAMAEPTIPIMLPEAHRGEDPMRKEAGMVQTRKKA